MPFDRLNRPDMWMATGRLVLASLFILGGFNKVMNYADTLGMMRAAGLEPESLLLPPTIALELGGGLLVAFGRRFAMPAALALALFTIATNIVFHRFWSMSGPETALQLSLFFKNVSIAGGLLFVAGASARGRTS
jgi:putative oxidoreductase